MNHNCLKNLYSFIFHATIKFKGKHSFIVEKENWLAFPFYLAHIIKFGNWPQLWSKLFLKLDHHRLMGLPLTITSEHWQTNYPSSTANTLRHLENNSANWPFWPASSSWMLGRRRSGGLTSNKPLVNVWLSLLQVLPARSYTGWVIFWIYLSFLWSSPVLYRAFGSFCVLAPGFKCTSSFFPCVNICVVDITTFHTVIRKIGSTFARFGHVV